MLLPNTKEIWREYRPCNIEHGKERLLKLRGGKEHRIRKYSRLSLRVGYLQKLCAIPRTRKPSTMQHLLTMIPLATTNIPFREEYRPMLRYHS
jgi:hypothetical protein